MCRTTFAYLVVAVLCFYEALTKEGVDIEELTGQSTRCSYDYAYGYYGAYCAKLGLSKVPNLKDSIEILDFSENKVRELKTDTFAEYTSLRRLYLAENIIFRIEENALASLTYLQSLDLSRNVIQILPNSLFQLPSLKKLQLSGNPLVPTYNALSRPIKAPLEYLDISDCSLTDLWNWGIMPQLLFYNVSHNPLTQLHVSHFADMCHLRKVDLSKSVDQVSLCDLKPSITWLKQRRVDYLLLDDSHVRLTSEEFASCPELADYKSTFIHELNSTQTSCLAAYKVPVPESRPARRTWATLCGGLAGFLVCFMMLLYAFHRFNVAKTKRASEKKKPPPNKSDRHSSALLLTNASSA